MTGISATGSNGRGTEAGFTLIEMLVALTIVSVLVASISFFITERRPTLKGSSVKIAQQLRLAQQRAMRNQRPFRVEVNLAENSFQLVDETLMLPEDVAVTVRTAEDELIDRETVGMTFFPDASSSGGTILLESERESFEISIFWITGKISIRQLSSDG
ncbi:MAG: prepilin-type N-terminal cleavage/methylation domain-containing protein [Gammaproteobacteria bacterium]|nr:prepilin-type N-terminal cleavage/methylation domain-containing protein [Gammaproteobacteria bacterium]MCP4978997.1 prepilin-type N-terminal cleavage/methylation domain-containing protein [Gammaproteobacteria bacterium]